MIEDSSFTKGRNNSDPYPPIGSRLGEYDLEQLIERSEFGAVFLTRKSASGTMFRLRILSIPTELPSEERIVFLGHFQQQANQLTELQHAHILPLLDYGTYSGMPYLVYPHIPAITLSKYVAQHTPLNALIVSHYLDQLAEGLAYAHAHAILHRNLTTDCISIQQDQNLLIADFGVMRLLELSRQHGKGEGGRDQLALYGMNAASSPAPEQMLGNAVDTSTDVYALGAVLYRMLTGHRAFSGRTRDEIEQQHLRAPVPPLSKWRSDLPAELDKVVARAMAKDPAQRYRQPGMLANAYHEVVAPNDRKRKPFTVTFRPDPIQQDVDKQKAPASTPQRPLSLQKRQPQKTGISRRQTLTWLVAGGSAAAAITAVAVFGSRYLQLNNAGPLNQAPSTPVSTTGGSTTAGQQGRVLARTADIPLNSDKQFPLPNGNNPGLLLHLQDGRFVAFDSTCTHAGCAVSYNTQNKLLECPCHGAVFDPAKNAAVVQGPAPSPLTAISIAVRPDGTIVENNG